MIKSVLIFNQLGKPRLIKFYEQLGISTQQEILREIHTLLSKRNDNLCNFLEGTRTIGNTDTRIIYRHYATLYFVFVTDMSESELGTLDLIQAFVESLDRVFENVCELDLIFHFDEIHYILNEVISAGMVIEVAVQEITKATLEAKRLAQPDAESSRFNELVPGNANDQSGDASNSIATFLSSLVINITVASIIFIIFCILRPRFKRVYAPRTYAVEKERRPEPVGNGLFSWIPAALRAPDIRIIEQSGLDTYMFLRTIRTMFIMFSVISIVSAGSILPVNILGTMRQTGLNSLSMGNVDPKSDWLWVHVGAFSIVVCWCLWTIIGELRVYTHLRMWWLTHPQTSQKAGASTILLSHVPHNLTSDEKRLYELFSVFPGGVRQVFVNRSSKELKDMVKKRDKLVRKLEAKLTKYAVKCLKAKCSNPPSEKDLLDCVEEIARCNQFIQSARQNVEQMSKRSSALVMFNEQIAAHMAAQSVLDFKPFSMSQVSMSVDPQDVLWFNLEISPWSRRIRGYLSFMVTLALTLLWTVIAAVLSSLVQIKSLAALEPFKWLQDSPVALGIFSGTVPSLILAVLMAILPSILRLLLVLEGTQRRSLVGLRLLHRYFFFQVWNVYLVTIFSSSIFQIAIQSVQQPGRIIELIQTQVPQSATNILTYVLLLAFVGAAKEILQGVPLAMRYIKLLLKAKSPREQIRAEQPLDFKWSDAIPTHSLVFLMGFSYAFLAPIVNWFVAVYFGLFYLIYRYQFLYVYNHANWSMGGLSFPKSTTQMLVGLYISQLYMLLMMVAKLNSSASAIMRVVVCALVMLITVGAHLYIRDVFMPAISYLPVKRAVDVARNPLLRSEFPNVLDEDGEVEKSLTLDERAARNRIYAMYSSMVPKSIIKLGLRLFPPSIAAPRASDDEEAAADHRSNRLSMVDQAPLADSLDVDLMREFSGPELRASAVCSLWVPLQDPMFSELVREIEHRGQGTVSVITKGTQVTANFKVKADPDVGLDKVLL
ncbi:phosphate metabolism protein 7 [Coemansia brasiliensis]|uniref:Phosphate metabolism protein 7 n=1 Tax=Coemansia brasiliensis TaxID=2650707 RepID=A0A9W8LZV0_9FUNG|nr:phosphate metabolism protein 7 [Coemansia brasiliensis]